jgi:cob(I)alamin adenosyltransferase
MGHRLSRIVTRTGDAGTTGLGDGSRVPKDAPRIEAIGSVDELNSTLGVLLAEPLPEPVAQCLVAVQHDLFDLGGELSIPGHTAVTDAHVARLEDAVEHFNADLAPLKEFILPGGTRAAAAAHVARTVCRRAERRLVALAEREAVGNAARRYLNRLSDLLFVLARVLNRAAARPDVLWRHDRGRPGARGGERAGGEGSASPGDPADGGNTA